MLHWKYKKGLLTPPLSLGLAALNEIMHRSGLTLNHQWIIAHFNLWCYPDLLLIQDNGRFQRTGNLLTFKSLVDVWRYDPSNRWYKSNTAIYHPLNVQVPPWSPWTYLSHPSYHKCDNSQGYSDKCYNKCFCFLTMFKKQLLIGVAMIQYIIYILESGSEN